VTTPSEHEPRASSGVEGAAGRPGGLVGRTLGPYRIQGLIGAGGMGEVYRACDPRLGRDVAVKVIAPALALEADAFARFEREARAVASLSHPNILAIHDFGTQDGITYAVSELLEGETLRQRISRDRLPWRKAVQIAIQIAEGLSAAHEHGIVHRDLKPDNVFLTSSGTAKILDFGVARVTSSSPTAGTSSALTEPGTFVGTVGYMSPEQVRREEVGPPSDLFAFGCVVYEMVAGTPPFDRRTPAETTAAILRDDPTPLPDQVPDVSPALDAIVTHCLEKRPRDRFHSAADMVFALRAAGAVTSSDAGHPVAVEAPPRGTQGRARWWIWAGAGALAGAAAVATILTMRSPSEPSAEYEPLTFRRGLVTNARFAGDGQTVVFSALWDGDASRVFVKRPESPDAVPSVAANIELLGLSRSGELAVRVGSTQIAAFGWKGMLAQMPMVGAAPRALKESVMTADWFPDGRTLAIVTDLGDRQRLDCGPGMHSYETRGYITDLRVAPSGDRVAFLEHYVRDALLGVVVLFDPGSGERRVLAGAPRGRDYLGLAWRPDGREIWFGEYGQLRAVTLEGVERTVAQLPESVRLHDIAHDGRVLLSQESRRVQMALASMDDPRVRDLSWLTWSLPMAFSPDGRLLLFTEFPQKPDADAIAALRPVDGSPLVRLGEGFASNISRDGAWVLAVRIGVPSQIVLLPTGAGEPRVMPRGGIETHSFGLFLPDGQEVVFLGREAGRGNRLYRQRISGGDPVAFSPEGLGLSLLLLSPDGSQIAATWKDRPWLFPLTGGEPRVLPGASPGEIAAGWTSDGQYVFVRGMAAETPLRRVNVRDGSATTVCIVRVPDAAGVQWIGPLVIAPDERRFAYGYHRVLATLYRVDGLR
jgi:hypothetical protein